MTTRPISMQGLYPFAPPVMPSNVPIIAGLKDAYFVIQGPPTGALPGSPWGSSSSDSSGSPLYYPAVGLVRVEPGVPTSRYIFWAIQGNLYWLIYFDVPNLGGTGQVRNTDATNVDAVLLFDTEELYVGPDKDVWEVIEPGRTQWHLERVTAIRFYNIWRDGLSNEQPEVLIPVQFLPDVSNIIRLEDGYNTTVVYDEDERQVAISVGVGDGKGNAPDYGQTAGSSASPESEQFVTIINGITPVNGDIPVETSPSLGIRRQQGRIEIIVKA